MISLFTPRRRRRNGLTLSLLVFALFAFACFQRVSAKAVLDFDGDGKTDYAITRSAVNQSQFLWWWYISLSSGGSTVQQFGLGSIVYPVDKILPEDYDGDGKCDIAVWRAISSDQRLYVLESGTNTIRTTILPGVHFSLLVQDYDGDGKADVADVWRDENQNKIWRIFESKSGGIRTVYFGTDSIDDPVKGDFDGDGIGDIAIYRNDPSLPVNTFYVLRSSDGMLEAMPFGKSGDRPIVADFDGDGKTDYAVTRDNLGSGTLGLTWYWIESSTGAFRSLRFGDAFHEQAVPGDYDGDRRTDQAVARLEGQNIIWYVNGSRDGMTAVQWGLGSDTCVATPTF